MIVRTEFLDEITSSEFWLLIQIQIRIEKQGYCYHSPRTLQQITGFGPDKLIKTEKSLLEKKFLVIDRLLDNIAFDQLCKRSYLDIISGCLFCENDKVPLHGHHYPVRKKDGGRHTIPLCPNCHALFHILTDSGVIRPLHNFFY